jgi:hypothetical protein
VLSDVVVVGVCWYVVCARVGLLLFYGLVWLVD